VSLCKKHRSYTPRRVSFMRNTVPTVSTAVPTGVTKNIGHVRRNQRSRCRNTPGHVHRNVGHDPGITGHVGPEYSFSSSDRRFPQNNSMPTSLRDHPTENLTATVHRWPTRKLSHSESSDQDTARRASGHVEARPPSVRKRLSDCIRAACLRRAMTPMSRVPVPQSLKSSPQSRHSICRVR
jgi:hypothetical protein